MAFSEAMAQWAQQQLCDRYWRQFGCELPLNAPQTLREKLFVRMVLLHRRHCRRYTLLSDKLAVRAYVRRCIGAAHLSPIVWSGSDPSQAPLEQYSDGGWIAKTNHGCGGHQIIQPGDQSALRRHLLRQLQQNYYWMAFEAQYFHIRPRLYLERLVQSPGQSPPLSYRLWCFAGRVALIQVDDGSLCNPMYSRSWQRLEVWYRHRARAADGCQAPAQLEQMIDLAESLAAPFGFVRVDLYHVGAKILFSELTFTPLAGDLWWEPPSWDQRLGALWPDEALV